MLVVMGITIWEVMEANRAWASVVDNRRVRVLLVGVSEYPTFRADLPAVGASTDLDLIALALESRGVPHSSILRLEDAAASTDAVLFGISDHLGSVGRGGHAFVHISGHGTRIVDADGDEADGFDEVFLTWNAGKSASGTGFAGRDGDVGLVDDQLADAISALRRRIGPRGSVTLSVDACFSAGLVRGIAGAPPTWRGLRESEGDIEGGTGAAPLIVLTATRDHELAAERLNPVPLRGTEGGSPGLYSAALSDALHGSARTWLEVYQRVRMLVAEQSRSQHPQAGGALESGVFGPSLRVHTFPMVVDGSDSSGRLRLRGGSLLDLRVGDRWEVVSAEGTVREELELVAVEPTFAFLAAPTNRMFTWEGAGAYRISRAEPPSLPTVEAASTVGVKGGARFAESRLFPSEGEGGLGVSEEVRGHSLDRDEPSGKELAEGNAVAGSAPTLVGSEERPAWIRRGAARSLMDLAAPVHPGLLLRVFTEVREGGGCSGGPPAERPDTDVHHVRVGEFLRIAVFLDGTSAEHLTLVHSDAEGAVRVLWPPPGAISEPLLPGAWWSPPVCWPVTEPTGDERLRAILSPLPLDLAPFHGSFGDSIGSPAAPVLESAMRMEPLRGAGGVADLLLTVQPRERVVWGGAVR
jgi:hypothetical protein